MQRRNTYCASITKLRLVCVGKVEIRMTGLRFKVAGSDQRLFVMKSNETKPVSWLVVKDTAIDTEGWSSIPGTVKSDRESPTARDCSDVFS